MSQLISVFIFLAFIAGVVGIAALWTQHDINRKREQDATAKKETEDPAA